MPDDKIDNYSKDLQRELTEHPAIMDGINTMIRQGYSNESIRRIIGGAATPEKIDAQRQALSGFGGVRRTDSELREMEEKRQADREKNLRK